MLLTLRSSDSAQAGLACWTALRAPLSTPCSAWPLLPRIAPRLQPDAMAAALGAPVSAAPRASAARGVAQRAAPAAPAARLSARVAVAPRLASRGVQRARRAGAAPAIRADMYSGVDGVEASYVDLCPGFSFFKARRACVRLWQCVSRSLAHNKLPCATTLGRLLLSGR
jgi:hypothetical protein